MSSLNKVFSIIETIVAHQDKGMTYSEIVSALDLPKSSVHRIVKTLNDLGYLTFTPETKRYFGSLRLAALGAEVMANFELRAHIRPYLLELKKETDHTANVGILDGITGVFLDKVESQDFGIKLFSEIGKTFPLHCTGLGKVLLAFSSENTLPKIIDQPLESFTEKTITDPAKLKKELKLIQEQGYGIDNEEITRGIICIAAPIFGFDKDFIAAISITFPAYINEDRGIKREIEAIKKYSVIISQSLGNDNTV